MHTGVLGDPGESMRVSYWGVRRQEESPPAQGLSWVKSARNWRGRTIRAHSRCLFLAAQREARADLGWTRPSSAPVFLPPRVCLFLPISLSAAAGPGPALGPEATALQPD